MRSIDTGSGPATPTATPRSRAIVSPRLSARPTSPGAGAAAASLLDPAAVRCDREGDCVWQLGQPTGRCAAADAEAADDDGNLRRVGLAGGFLHRAGVDLGRAGPVLRDLRQRAVLRRLAD